MPFASLSTRTRLIATLLLVLLVSAACGLPSDTAPSAIASTQLPEDLRPGQIPTPTPTPDAGRGSSDQIHMIKDNRLITVDRTLAASPEELLQILLVGTRPEEAAQGIQTAISRGTRVTDVDVNELFKVATVDLAPGSLEVRNSEKRLAFAQIVYTLTSVPGIESVRFTQADAQDPSADPIKLDVQRDNGTSSFVERVTRESFASLDPTPRSASPSFELPTAVPIDPNAAEPVLLSLWLLDEENQLIEVQRLLEDSPEALLVSLFGGPLPDETALGIRSALPLDALVDSIRTECFDAIQVDVGGFETTQPTNIAIVELTDGSLPDVDMTGARFLAVAQIVFTLTDFPGIDQVVFTKDGEWQPTIRDGGTSLPFAPDAPMGLSPQDYASLLPEGSNTVPTTADSSQPLTCPP